MLKLVPLPKLLPPVGASNHSNVPLPVAVSVVELPLQIVSAEVGVVLVGAGVKMDNCIAVRADTQFPLVACA